MSQTKDEDKNQGKTSWLDAWHVNPSTNKDYDLIDGLRGIAILDVVICHLIYINPNAGRTIHFLGGLFSAANYGVVIFFTLSGFLIALPFWKRKLRPDKKPVPPGYFQRRFWKIYPPLALFVLLFTPIYIYRLHDWSFLNTASQWLIGWPLILPVSGKLNPVMWSLIVEVQFYMLLPLIFMALRRVAFKTCLWIVSLVFFLVPALTRWLCYDGATLNLYPVIEVHFPSLLDSFVFGILLAGLESRGGILTKGWAKLGDVGWMLLILAIIAKAWLFVHPANIVLDEALVWVVRIASVFLLCYITDPQNPRARLLCQPWLRWLGIVSYELYLVHQPIVYWARQSFGPAGGNLCKYAAILGGTLVVSLFIAAMTYKNYSLPILKAGRKKAG